jgi:hypothetical protein
VKKGVSKVKICISLDIDIYEKLKKISDRDDSKVSTKINSILKKLINKKKR